MPQSIGSPNPQNGSNNPYNPSPGYTGAGAGQTYNIGNPYNTITAHPLGAITKADIDRLTIQPTSRTVLELQWVNGDLQFIFMGEENGSTVKMTLSPEADIKPIELLRLNTLIHACSNGIGSSVNVMSFVRRHNLERHFSFASA